MSKSKIEKKKKKVCSPFNIVSAVHKIKKEAKNKVLIK